MELFDGTLETLLNKDLHGDLFIDFANKISKGLHTPPRQILFTTSDDELEFCESIGLLSSMDNIVDKFIKIDEFIDCKKLTVGRISVIYSCESGLSSVFFRAQDLQNLELINKLL